MRYVWLHAELCRLFPLKTWLCHEPSRKTDMCDLRTMTTAQQARTNHDCQPGLQLSDR